VGPYHEGDFDMTMDRRDLLKWGMAGYAAMKAGAKLKRTLMRTNAEYVFNINGAQKNPRFNQKNTG